MILTFDLGNFLREQSNLLAEIYFSVGMKEFLSQPGAALLACKAATIPNRFSVEVIPTHS